MIIKEKKSELEIISEEGEDFQTIEFGIRQEDQGKILDFLRSKMYENPIGSICREISCNARDANREAGRGSIPIKITIESSSYLVEGETVISFSDSGVGISPDRMQDIFCNYGASTKSNTNRLTGGFGLGAKTPFSYSDVFFVETIFDHVKYLYQAALDSGNGKMILLEKSECKDRNGTTISIPIKDYDRQEFEREVIQYCKYWSVKPLIEGFKYENPIFENNITAYGTVYEENIMIIYPRSGRFSNGIFITIDDIPYPLNLNQFRDVLESGKNIQFDICLPFKNGEISVSANRETLYYDEVTLKKVKSRLKKILDKVQIQVQEKIDSFETNWEAYKYIHNKLTNDFYWTSIFVNNPISKKLDNIESVQYRGLSFPSRREFEKFIRSQIFVKTKHSIDHSWGEAIIKYGLSNDKYSGGFDLYSNKDHVFIMIEPDNHRFNYKKDTNIYKKYSKTHHIWFVKNKRFNYEQLNSDNDYFHLKEFLAFQEFFNFEFVSYSDIEETDIQRPKQIKEQKPKELQYIVLSAKYQEITKHNSNYPNFKITEDKLNIEPNNHGFNYSDNNYVYIVYDRHSEIKYGNFDEVSVSERRLSMKMFFCLSYHMEVLPDFSKNLIVIKSQDEKYFKNHSNFISADELHRCKEWMDYQRIYFSQIWIKNQLEGLIKENFGTDTYYIINFLSEFSLVEKIDELNKNYEYEYDTNRFVKFNSLKYDLVSQEAKNAIDTVRDIINKEQFIKSYVMYCGIDSYTSDSIREIIFKSIREDLKSLFII